MQRGARKLHRSVVNAGLKHSIDKAVRSGAFSLQSLGFATGFPNPQILATQLHGAFPCSPLNLRRWRNVAQMCGYAGDPIHTGDLLEGHDDHG